MNDSFLSDSVWQILFLWLVCSFSWHCLFLNINDVMSSTLSLCFHTQAFGLAYEPSSLGSYRLSPFSSSRHAVVFWKLYRFQKHFDLLLWRLVSRFILTYRCPAVYLPWQGYISTFPWHFITTTTSILHTGFEIPRCFCSPVHRIWW